MCRVLGRIYRLTLLAASGPRAWIGFCMFGSVLALEFLGVWVDLQMIAWYKRFYDAIEQVDAPAAIRELWVFGAIILASATIFLVGDYIRKRLLLRWRAQLTDEALGAWTNSKAYWHLRPGLSPEGIDNPDQRVAADCRHFVEDLLRETIDVITRIVALFSYVVVLRGMSDFVLTLPILGADLTVSHYLVWLAPIYVLASSVITHLLGYPLKSLYFRQERREADFRYALVQLRDNATEIAMSDGEQAERRRLSNRFEVVRQNWYRLIRGELVLGLFARPYFQSILRVPLFFSLPAYFAGAVTLGGLMQLSAAFGRVTQTLSWFIFSYKELASFVAVSHRLDDVFKLTADPEAMPGVPCDIVQTVSSDETLRVKGLQLATPEGRWLDAVPDREIRPSDRVWISGPSGNGKSTLLAALCGVWRYGTGEIVKPKDISFMSLPQRPLVCNENLTAAACYPCDPDDFPEGAIRDVLVTVGLGHRLSLMDKGEVALEGLSMGERQRLAMARLFLMRPDWIILDEATSSLDATAELHLLGKLLEEVPNATILCVSHRPPSPLAPYDIWPIGQTETLQKDA